jgi:peptide/nickel transport system permease protein
MTRSSMLEVIRQDYIRTARAKGLKQSAVTRRHALKNGLIPVITVVGSQLSMIMGGSILVETIFSIPGLGTLMNTAISSKNYPVVQSGILMISVTVCIMNLVVDLAYAFIDPRIKAQYTGTKKKKKEPEETQPAAQEVA